MWKYGQGPGPHVAIRPLSAAASEAITRRPPARMGLGYGRSEDDVIARAATPTPRGAAYRNLCIGWDRFHEVVLGPILHREVARRRAARELGLPPATVRQ